MADGSTETLGYDLASQRGLRSRPPKRKDFINELKLQHTRASPGGFPPSIFSFPRDDRASTISALLATAWPWDEQDGDTITLSLMRKAPRLVLGIAIVGLVLCAADLATRDCKVGPSAYDNCMWIRVRAYLGLPPSRLLRMATLEFVGIALAMVLYLAFRYVFPFRRTTPAAQDSSQTHVPGPPSNSQISDSETAGEPSEPETRRAN